MEFLNRRLLYLEIAGFEKDPHKDGFYILSRDFVMQYISVGTQTVKT